MFFAHGHYLSIGELDTNPKLTTQKAKEVFAMYKNIPLDKITNFISELIIKDIGNDSVTSPTLVYRIYLFANYESNNEFGFIDAQSGSILATEPAQTDFSATGTFTTRYSGTLQSTTQNYNGAFHLADSTRNAIIHTWNLNGSTNYTDRIELSDNNNIWTVTEHSASENDMGLDVHWALQQIYDHLNNNYGINSYNDLGFPINAHIHYGNSSADKDNARWNLALDVLAFGDGDVFFRPVASLDAVAHEYGHGITDFQIGWAYSGNGAAFHEGLSDIWAAVLEQRIMPNSIWKIGEQIDLTYNCLRNIQNTNDQNARVKISDTYLSTQYNNGDQYTRGGVFSHWFYLLVNGGTGTNSIGNNYTVHGVGMDMAENLIVEAVINNYLDNTTTYPGIRTAMINAATTLCSGQNSALVQQVENAWYAVGVGTIPNQLSLSVPSLVCSSGATFTVNNVPENSTVTWTCSSKLSFDNQPGNSKVFYAIGNGTATVTATINSTNCGSVTLPAYNVLVGTQKPGTVSIDFDAPPGRFTASIDAVPSATSYKWYCDGVLTYDNGTTIARFVRDISNCEHVYYVDVASVNTCGVSEVSNGMVSEPPCDYLIITPNPGTDNVLVSISSPESLNSTSGSSGNASSVSSTSDVLPTFTVRIFDSFGVLYNTFTKTGDSFTVPVNNLKEGTYIVTVGNSVKYYSGKLIIKR